MSKKIRKYNPKPYKVCVGEFMLAVNKALSEELKKETNEEMVNAQYAIMNIIFLKITDSWCRCPWCVRHAHALMERIEESQKSLEGTKKE